jgi:hypothetical protein
MTDNDIHVIGFIDRLHLDLRRPPTNVNLDNIVKGYFHSMSRSVLEFDGQPSEKTIGHFIKISYITHNGISNDGYFYLECLVDDSRGMPSQFLKDNQEFEVIFNGKRYEYKDLKQLYIDYVNYETVTTIDSLP